MLICCLISEESSIMNLFLQNSQPSIHPSWYGTFEVVHLSRRQNLWMDKWILYHHNVPSHTEPSLKWFLAIKHVPTLGNPLFLLDLAPCGLYPFHQRVSLKESHFESLLDIQKNMMGVLKGLCDNNSQWFPDVSRQWITCIEQGGSSFEGDCIHQFTVYIQVFPMQN